MMKEAILGGIYNIGTDQMIIMTKIPSAMMKEARDTSMFNEYFQVAHACIAYEQILAATYIL